jgi:hypothetical protein
MDRKREAGSRHRAQGHSTGISWRAPTQSRSEDGFEETAGRRKSLQTRLTLATRSTNPQVPLLCFRTMFDALEWHGA